MHWRRAQWARHCAHSLRAGVVFPWAGRQAGQAQPGAGRARPKAAPNPCPRPWAWTTRCAWPTMPAGADPWLEARGRGHGRAALRLRPARVGELGGAGRRPGPRHRAPGPGWIDLGAPGPCVRQGQQTPQPARGRCGHEALQAWLQLRPRPLHPALAGRRLFVGQRGKRLFRRSRSGCACASWRQAGADHAGAPAHAAPLVCQPPAAIERRPACRCRNCWPRQHHHHAGLHPAGLPAPGQVYDRAQPGANSTILCAGAKGVLSIWLHLPRYFTLRPYRCCIALADHMLAVAFGASALPAQAAVARGAAPKCCVDGLHHPSGAHAVGANRQRWYRDPARAAEPPAAPARPARLIVPARLTQSGGPRRSLPSRFLPADRFALHCARAPVCPALPRPGRALHTPFRDYPEENTMLRHSTSCPGLSAWPAAFLPQGLGSDQRCAGPITITGSAIDDRFLSSATDPVSSITIGRKQGRGQHAKNLIEVLRNVSGITADLQGDGRDRQDQAARRGKPALHGRSPAWYHHRLVFPCTSAPAR